jgi:hypothetical protein
LDYLQKQKIKEILLDHSLHLYHLKLFKITVDKHIKVCYNNTLNYEKGEINE